MILTNICILQIGSVTYLLPVDYFPLYILLMKSQSCSVIARTSYQLDEWKQPLLQVCTQIKKDNGCHIKTFSQDLTGVMGVANPASGGTSFL